MATSPSTRMSVATLPSNSSPGFAVRELIVEERITGSSVPAGTTKGFGGGGGGSGTGAGAGWCCAVVWSAGPGCEPDWLLSVDEFPFLPHPAASPNMTAITTAAHLLFMMFPHVLCAYGVMRCRGA